MNEDDRGEKIGKKERLETGKKERKKESKERETKEELKDIKGIREAGWEGE